MLEAIGITLLAIGLLLHVLCGISLIFKAFDAGLLWGLGFLFVPLVSIIFAITHWEDVKETFLKYLLSFPILLLAYYLTPATYFNHF